jgi:hypothetical protein
VRDGSRQAHRHHQRSAELELLERYGTEGWELADPQDYREGCVCQPRATRLIIRAWSFS